MKPFNKTSLIVVALLGIASSASAKPLTEVGLYRRCYSHLTGEVPPFDDSNLAAIRAGTMKALDGCNDLLNRISINPTDSLGRLQNPSDPVAKKGLNHLYRVARKFTKNNQVNGKYANYIEAWAATEDIYDMTAVALVYTENALNPSRQFKDIFDITKAAAAYRVPDPMYASTFQMKTIYNGDGGTANNTTYVNSGRTRHGGMQNYANHDLVPYKTGPYTSSNVILNQPFQVALSGELEGIHYNQSVQVASAAPYYNDTYGLQMNFDIQSTIGKGVIGLRPYLLANADLLGSINSFHMHRRLLQSVIRDFLCREVPVVRESDIVSYVSTNSNANPFRKAPSCVACHATMDQAAASVRGLALLANFMGNGGAIPGPSKNALHPALFSVTKPAESVWPEGIDDDYSRRPTNGKFYFRTYNGKLINQNLTSYSDLSSAIANTDDAYICAAQKYFQHFTGINVKIFDVGDTKNANLMSLMTERDWAYRNFVVKLGLELKQHQKLKTMMSEIISSDFYRSSNFDK